MESFTVRISGSGIARNGMSAIKTRREMYNARAAISCLHDALLAVAKGKITPEQVREFFWRDDMAEAQFYGDVLSLDEEEARR